jgi:hypothetical protein
MPCSIVGLCTDGVESCGCITRTWSQLQSFRCKHVIKITCFFLKNDYWFRHIHSCIKINLLIIILLMSSMFFQFSKCPNTKIAHKVSLWMETKLLKFSLYKNRDKTSTFVRHNPSSALVPVFHWVVYFWGFGCYADDPDTSDSQRTLIYNFLCFREHRQVQ